MLSNCFQIADDDSHFSKVCSALMRQTRSSTPKSLRISSVFFFMYSLKWGNSGLALSSAKMFLFSFLNVLTFFALVWRSLEKSSLRSRKIFIMSMICWATRGSLISTSTTFLEKKFSRTFSKTGLLLKNRFAPVSFRIYERFFLRTALNPTSQ